jgi:hypothetical protein
LTDPLSECGEGNPSAANRLAWGSRPLVLSSSPHSTEPPKSQFPLTFRRSLIDERSSEGARRDTSDYHLSRLASYRPDVGVLLLRPLEFHVVDR